MILKFRQPYLDADTGGTGGAIETQPVEQQAEQQAPIETPVEQPQIKVKYNHQEMELPYEEAVTHIQKGMNYEKAVEKARQEARDAWIEEQGYEHNGKPIKTEAEYKEALKELELRQKYSELPDDVVNELIESKKFREQFETEKQTKAEQEKRNAEYQEFFEYFQAENGRDFNTATDTIPQEVWDLVNKGKTLTDAYTYNLKNNLKAKIAELESKLKAQEINTKNAQSTPGSVTGNGTGTDYISFDTYESNKHDQSWVNKNFSKIMESRRKW